MVLIFIGTDKGNADALAGQKETPRYLASFFPRPAPFSRSGVNNRLNRKKAARKVEALNKENYRDFERKAAPIISLVHTLTSQSDRTRQVLIFWQMGELIHHEKAGHKGNEDYDHLLIQSLSRDSGLDIQTIRDIERLHDQYTVAATLSLQLTWEHYRILITIKDNAERAFYQGLAVGKHWTPEELGTAVRNNLYKPRAVSP